MDNELSAVSFIFSILLIMLMSFVMTYLMVLLISTMRKAKIKKKIQEIDLEKFDVQTFDKYGMPVLIQSKTNKNELIFL